jgi:hypothetical protein
MSGALAMGVVYRDADALHSGWPGAAAVASMMAKFRRCSP